MHGEMVRMWNLQCRYCSGFYCKAGNAIHIRGAVRTVQQDGEHEMMFKTSYNGKKVSEKVVKRIIQVIRDEKDLDMPQ